MNTYQTQASLSTAERHRHMPFYRYEVAYPAFRLMLNHYGWKVIGAGIVVGRFYYGVLWGRA